MPNLVVWFSLAFCSLVTRTALATSFPPLPLPSEVHESYVDCVNSTGLIVHTLSAGCDGHKPLVLLLHGFPEIAYTWVYVMPQLASQGYCVVAPDLRGAGRTLGWNNQPFAEVDLDEFSYTNMVRDLVALVYGLGYTEAFSVIGHDYGAIVTQWAALIRPDIFRSCIHISNPFDPAALPPSPAPSYSSVPPNLTTVASKFAALETSLEALPVPRMYYQWSNSQPAAANDWNTGGVLGLRDFYRGYFYVKSADWPGNNPHALESYTAQQLALIPYYYVMLRNETMSETVATLTNSYNNLSIIDTWLPDKDLDVYVNEFQRTGFQGELNWYRVLTGTSPDALLMSGRQIVVPTIYFAGDKDWGTYQHPGALEAYNNTCSQFRGAFFITGAGHWVQLEQPKHLTEMIVNFLESLSSPSN